MSCFSYFFSAGSALFVASSSRTTVPAANRAVRLAHPRVQQPQVVVHLGDRADGGPRVAARRLLVDRDRRGQPVDEVHVGLVHLPEELPRVRGEGLDVPALSLGEDRVEGQAGLAGTGQAGEHDHGVAGQVDGDVLQVVLACPANDKPVSHCALFSLSVKKVGRLNASPS
jgi:hypothetical protein